MQIPNWHLIIIYSIEDLKNSNSSNQIQLHYIIQLNLFLSNTSSFLINPLIDNNQSRHINQIQDWTTS